MLRILLPALLALFANMALLTAGESRPPEFRSIPPLTALVEIEGKQVSKITCTAFSIDEDRKHWMTAAHCLGRAAIYQIEGENVTPVVVDVENDIAILKTHMTSAPGIKLGGRLRFGQEVTIIGYPLGIPLVTKGWAANPTGVIPDPRGQMRALFQTMTTVGGSGGPILNNRREVVGVLTTVQSQQYGMFGPFAGGVPWEVLNRFRLFFEGERSEDTSVLQRLQPVR